jgi:hypothetical protein
MASDYKVLGQVAPAATTVTLYTVPSGEAAVVTNIIVANRHSSTSSYRIAVRPSTSTTSVEHFIAYDIDAPGLGTTALTLGLTLQAGYLIEVTSSSSNLSFSAFGTEIV